MCWRNALSSRLRQGRRLCWKTSPTSARCPASDAANSTRPLRTNGNCIVGPSAQFFTFVEYKGQERGNQVVRVDPRHPSQTCSRYGHQARNNRRPQALFLCRRCGYCINADYNAAKNIRDKHLTSLASLGTPLGSGSPRQAASRLDSL